MRGNVLFSRSSTGSFLSVAMLKALKDLKAVDVANTVRERIRYGVYLSFESAREAVQSCGGKVVIKKLNIGNDDAMERSYGVCIIKLKQRQILDHFIVVNGNDSVDIDSAERPLLTLSEDVLRLFSGDAASNVMVGRAWSPVKTSQVRYLHASRILVAYSSPRTVYFQHTRESFEITSAVYKVCLML